MNVAQEFGDDEFYDYDILVKLLGDRFDPASHVSASSRFHGRSRRHPEDGPDRAFPEPAIPPSLLKMFALARMMGYEM